MKKTRLQKDAPFSHAFACKSHSARRTQYLCSMLQKEQKIWYLNVSQKRQYHGMECISAAELFCLIWHDMVRYIMVCYGVVWFGLAWYLSGAYLVSPPLYLTPLYICPPSTPPSTYASSSKAAPSSSSTSTSQPSINFFHPPPDTFLSRKAGRSLDRNCFSIWNFLQRFARASRSTVDSVVAFWFC